MLDSMTPRLATIVLDNDRLTFAISSISTNVIAPTIHAKTFPENLSSTFLKLLSKLQKAAGNSKSWKKETTELFNSPRLFSCTFSLVPEQLLPAIGQWNLFEKDRLLEVIGRVPAPTSAGIMFGVGANAARQEADKKAQLNLRRAILLLLAAEQDGAASHLNTIEEICFELTGPTPASSPSSCTRAELFMLMRAIVLKTSAVHLTSLWLVISTELHKAIGSASSSSNDYDTYNSVSLLEACKLLDLLIILAPDEFQLHEWLFIADTIDAVYRPETWEPVSLVDELAEELGVATELQSPAPLTPSVDATAVEGATSEKRPLLKVPDAVVNMTKDDLVANVLRPWFTQLSIHAFETTYKMGSFDLYSAKQSLLKDLFDDSTLIG